MIKFDKPESLNGDQLLDELAAVGIILDKFTQPPLIDGNGDFWLRIDAADETKAKIVVEAHNGNTNTPQLTVQEKLAAAGLTIDELREALGL